MGRLLIDPDPSPSAVVTCSKQQVCDLVLLRKKYIKKRGPKDPYHPKAMSLRFTLDYLKALKVDRPHQISPQ